MRWVRLYAPDIMLQVFTGDWRDVGYPIDEAPKRLYESVQLATDQEVGLFVYKSLPRPMHDTP